MLDEHGTALAVPFDDAHVRWMLGRLRDTAGSLRRLDRERAKTEQRREVQVLEAVRAGFAVEDVARFARMSKADVEALVAREQQVRLGWGPRD